jgi:hypothetical protein
MGQARTLAEMVNLEKMTPETKIAQTRYCLANTGFEYLVYHLSEYSTRIWVDLSAAKGELEVQYFNPETGILTKGSSITGGGIRVFLSPFSGDGIIYIKKRK